MRITVIVSDDEYGKMRAAAGAVPLSRWLRALGMSDVARREQAERDQSRAEGKTELLLEDQKISKTEVSPERRTVRRGSRTLKAIEDVTHEALRKMGRKCQHGVASGYHCWQCGGIAKVV